MLTEDIALAPSEFYVSLLHRSALNGEIKHFPIEVLTKDNLSTQDRDGNTVFHILGSNGYIDLVPAETLTRETLTIPNKFGATPLHGIADAGDLQKLPNNLISEDILQISDGEANTVFHYATNNGSVLQLPEEMLTEHNLLWENQSGETPLQYILENYDPVAEKSCVRKVVKTLSMPVLMEYATGTSKAVKKLLMEEIGARKLHKKLSQKVKSLDLDLQ
jgi:ankyrin repeat protein